MNSKMKKTKRSLSGTSFYGHVVEATVLELKQALGKESFRNGDKTQYEWHMELGDDVFSVYDYKLYTPIDPATTMVEWHIGGRSGAVTEAAAAMIQAKVHSLYN
jgi:hypothetical protein